MVKSKKKNRKRVPRYSAVLFLVLPFVSYFALNFSFTGTMFLKEILGYRSTFNSKLKEISLDIENMDIKNMDIRNNQELKSIFDLMIKDKDLKPETLVKRVYIRDIYGTFIAIIILIFLFNVPIKIYFVRKRFGKKISPFILRYTRSLINYSPEIIALIYLLGSIHMHNSFIGMINSIPDLDSVHNTIQKLFIISLFTSILVLLLIYFGQKFRVQTKYIDHVFSEKRLHRLPRGFNFPGIRARFFITTVFLTFVPLIIISFYAISGINLVENLDSLSDSQLDFIYGDLIELTQQIPFLQDKIMYVSYSGIIQMFIGIVPGLFFSAIFIFKITTWSNISIVKPIKELLKSMKQVERGNLNSYTVVRSREETGQLVNGFNRMLTGLKDRDRIKSLFGQYLSSEVSAEILKGNVDLTGNLYQATILFADIRGFTTLSESITPQETITFLNEYYAVIIDVILEHGGIIDKFMGDGILVLFGVPIDSKDHADKAVAAALEMRERLAEFNMERTANGIFPVNIGIGIHTGEVIAGNVGNSHKLEYTVIGDTVNIASRIETLTKKFETDMLIGESVYDSLSKGNSSRERFEILKGVSLKGKKTKVNLLKINS